MLSTNLNTVVLYWNYHPVGIDSSIDEGALQAWGPGFDLQNQCKKAGCGGACFWSQHWESGGMYRSLGSVKSQPNLLSLMKVEHAPQYEHTQVHKHTQRKKISANDEFQKWFSWLQGSQWVALATKPAGPSSVSGSHNGMRKQSPTSWPHMCCACLYIYICMQMNRCNN